MLALIYQLKILVMNKVINNQQINKFHLCICLSYQIKQSKAFMKKQCFLNDIFQKNHNRDDVEKNKKFNTIKFANCFNTKAGPSYRHRQIRILQIGNACSAQVTKKQGLISKTKTPSSGFLNNEILKEDINSLLKVESTKRQGRTFINQKSQNQQKMYQTQKSKNKNNSPEKDEFDYKQYLSITQSPKKTVLWLTKKRNIDSVPNRIIEKHYQNNNNQIIREDSSEQVSRSANLLNKIKIIDEMIESKQEKRTFTNLQNRRKPKLQTNRKTPQQIAEEERKAKLQIKRQISMDYAKPFNPPTNISAYSYIVYEPQFSKKGKKKNYTVQAKFIQNGLSDEIRSNMQKKYPHSHKILASLNSRNAVQVASLTKIMTCTIALDLCEQNNLNSLEEKVVIGKFQSNIGGTSAQISQGQTYTLQDLYYGLMLPSGNDASIAIAVWGGRVLLTKEEEEKQKVHKKKDCYNRFIEEMNNKAKFLGLQKTTYANSHGLVNSANKSCAYDLAVLCQYAMKNKKFKKIVSCKLYQTRISYLAKRVSSPLPTQKKASTKNLNRIEKVEKDDEVEEGVEIDLDSNEDDEQISTLEEFVEAQKSVQWENTHRLLQLKPEEYIGIKTGITTAAGPCLASCIKSKGDRYFIIIVLGCDKMSMRFKDTETLKRWAYNRESVQSPKKKTREQRQTSNEVSSSLKPLQ